jgi:phosphomevalonate kinase
MVAVVGAIAAAAFGLVTCICAQHRVSELKAEIDDWRKLVIRISETHELLRDE